MPGIFFSFTTLLLLLQFTKDRPLSSAVETIETPQGSVVDSVTSEKKHIQLFVVFTILLRGQVDQLSEFQASSAQIPQNFLGQAKMETAHDHNMFFLCFRVSPIQFFFVFFLTLDTEPISAVVLCYFFVSRFFRPRFAPGSVPRSRCGATMAAV